MNNISQDKYFWDFEKLDVARAEMDGISLDFNERNFIEAAPVSKPLQLKKIIEILLPIIAILVIVFIL